jgi:hypothetical protein
VHARAGVAGDCQICIVVAVSRIIGDPALYPQSCRGAALQDVWHWSTCLGLGPFYARKTFTAPEARCVVALLQGRNASQLQAAESHPFVGEL